MTKTNALPRLVGATVLFLLAVAALALPASSLAAPEGAPLLKLSPSPATFPKTTAGFQSQTQTLDVANEGDAEASIGPIAIEGADPSAFNFNGSDCGSLQPGQHCSVWIGFVPADPGEKQALLSFHLGGFPEQSFELSGTAVAPQLTFAPDSHDFGLRRIYETSNTYFQLTNSGEAAVQLNNLQVVGGSGSFWTGNSDCWGSWLAPGASCSMEVDFSAQDAVVYEAELRAYVNGYAFAATLSGQGGRPIVEASPNPLDFGAGTVGSSGPVHTITLTNSGNIPAGFFIGIVAGGDSASFQLLSENCTGAELMPAASCTARVRFRPQDAGPKAAYLAFFGDNDGGAMVGLEGDGVAPAVTLAPSAFDFGSQAAATKSEAHAFAVRNDGSTALDLSTVAIVGADLDQFALAGDECTGETLAPGAECLVRVRFTPDSAGAKAAKLRVGSDSGAFLATLAGTGTEGTAGAAPRQDDAFAQPGPPPPPRPWRQGRNRRFVRGATISAGKLERPRRTKVRAGRIPR